MLKVWIVGSEGQIGEAINEVLDPLRRRSERNDTPQDRGLPAEINKKRSWYSKYITA